MKSVNESVLLILVFIIPLHLFNHENLRMTNSADIICVGVAMECGFFSEARFPQISLLAQLLLKNKNHGLRQFKA